MLNNESCQIDDTYHLDLPLLKVDEIKELQPELEESFVFMDDNIQVVTEDMKQEFLKVQQQDDSRNHIIIKGIQGKQKSVGSFNRKPKEVMISLDIVIPKK